MRRRLTRQRGRRCVRIWSSKTTSGAPETRPNSTGRDIVRAVTPATSAKSRTASQATPTARPPLDHGTPISRPATRWRCRPTRPPARCNKHGGSRPAALERPPVTTLRDRRHRAVAHRPAPSPTEPAPSPFHVAGTELAPSAPTSDAGQSVLEVQEHGRGAARGGAQTSRWRSQQGSMVAERQHDARLHGARQRARGRIATSSMSVVWEQPRIGDARAGGERIVARKPPAAR